jgi:hypothetical protein
MNSTPLSDQESIKYLPSSIKRAKRALDCAPFRLDLFLAMRSRSIPLPAIAEDLGLQNSYTSRPISELSVEGHLMWLIQVGILRREVDGQGITDSFRLTPLGRQIVAERENGGQTVVNPGLWERISNFLTRWLGI